MKKIQLITFNWFIDKQGAQKFDTAKVGAYYQGMAAMGVCQKIIHSPNSETGTECYVAYFEKGEMSIYNPNTVITM